MFFMFNLFGGLVVTCPVESQKGCRFCICFAEGGFAGALDLLGEKSECKRPLLWLLL
jgi:hypothetical protein